MADLFVAIDDTLNTMFREAAVKRFGLKRGHLKKAMEDAIRVWLEEIKKTTPPQ